MTRSKGIGKTGLVLAVMAMIAMTAVSYLLRPDSRLSGELGICLPSPNLWEINPVSSWIINTVLTGAVAFGAFFLNRTHNFIRSTQPVLPVMFLLLAGSNPWINYYLSSSTLICAINLISLSILFGEYNSRNATQPMFAIGTFMSVGSMFQYAFLPMIVALTMKGRYSDMNYGEVKHFDIADGNGVRVSLFVSGCTNHCKGCFQPETWDFNYGKPYTKETEQEIFEALRPN